MFTKRVAKYLLASVFAAAVCAPSAVSQPRDVNCDKQEMAAELRGKCDENVKFHKLDRTITNSTTQGDDESNANANSANRDSSADTGSTDGDHDNGHGNDPDHDDSSNPGQGGGNHGTGNNGGGKGKGK